MHKKMAHTSSIMDEPIEEDNYTVLKPTRYEPRRVPPVTIERNLNRFEDEMMEYLSRANRRLRRRVRKRVARLRREIRGIYQRYDRHQLVERERTLNGFLRTHRVDGVRGYDQRTFTHYIRPRVVRFLCSIFSPSSSKVHTPLLNSLSSRFMIAFRVCIILILEVQLALKAII